MTYATGGDDKNTVHCRCDLESDNLTIEIE